MTSRSVADDPSTSNAFLTKTAHHRREAGGIIVTTLRPDAANEHTVEDARENVRVINRLCNGKRRPMLLDMGEQRLISREARDYYMGPEAIANLSARAIVAGTPLGRALANLYLQVNRPTCPSKLFGSVDEAMKWLVDYLK